MSDPKSFLKHIAGLRGFAIIAVVLFHLNGQFFPNGYLGVDVFLVITGYLLFLGCSKSPNAPGWRDTLQFLGKRICRIMPAMLALILLTLVVGAVLLQPQDEIFVSRVGYMACLLKANLFLQEEQSNYFAADTDFNPLLHLWYLSVALQIYFIWAAGRFALQRLPRKGAIALAIIIGLASLAYHYSFALHEQLSAWGLPTWKQQSAPSYYATLPRLWEVLAGGAAFLLPALPARRLWAHLIAALSAALILLPILAGCIPGLSWVAELPCTLLVVVGSVLLIRYAPQGRPAGLLVNPFMLWLGGISFSVYLVHMPIIIYGKLWVYGSPSVWYSVGLIVVSLLLGQAYWWCVEKRRVALWAVLLLWVATMLFCRAGRKTEGFRHYIPMPNIVGSAYENWQPCRDAALTDNWDTTINEELGAFRYMQQPDPHLQAPLLAIGNSSLPPTFVFMGDSFAQCLYSGFQEVASRDGSVSGVYLASIVEPFDDWEHYLNKAYYYNPTKDRALHRWLQAHPQLTHVIIAQSWNGRFESIPDCENRLRRFLKKLQAAGKKVIILSSLPHYPKNSLLGYQRALLLRGTDVRDITVTCPADEYAEQNKNTLPVLRRLQEESLCTLIDLRDALRPGEPFYAARDGRLYTLDTCHFSTDGAIWLMERLSPRLLRKLIPSTNDEGRSTK